MNFKSLIFLAVSALVFASCSSDDEKKPDHPLVGTWILTNYSLSGCNDESVDYSESTSCTEVECTKIQFKSDGTLVYIETYDGVTDTEPADYVIDGNTVLACESPNDCGDLQTFTIDGDILTLVSVSEGNGCTETMVLIKE